MPAESAATRPFAYGWAFSTPVRKVFYNLTVTGLSVAVALVIGAIELVAVLADRLSLHGGVWDRLGAIDLNAVGYGIVAAFDLTSIYRNLERLEAMGVVRHVHFGHGPGLYSLLGQGEREYLVCERCGKVVSVEPRQLDPAREAVRRRFGYEARFSHFPLMGLCPDCAS